VPGLFAAGEAAAGLHGANRITDNAIIPLKERVVDEFYDPLLMLVRKIRGAK